MKKFRVFFLIMTVIVIFGAVVAYGLFSGNGFDFTPILGPFIKLFLSFIQFVIEYIAAPSFVFPDILYLVGIIGGPLLALILFFVGLKRKDFFAAVLGFLSPILFVYALVGLFIPYYPNIPENLDNATPYLEIFLNDINTNIIRASIFGFVFGITIIVTFILMITFITANFRASRKQKKITVVPSTAQTPLHATSSAAGPQPSIPVSPIAGAPSTQDTQLADLIKLVMAEELNAMRGGYPAPGNPGFAMNGSQGYGLDVNLVRRIVVEELAKFQGHYISRPEAQMLIAQEIAMIKAQLKIK